ATGSSGSGFGGGSTIARLDADVPFGGQANFEVVAGDPRVYLGGFSQDQVRVAGGLGDNEALSTTIRASDPSGTQVTETFDIVTGDATDQVIDLSASTNDTTVYGREGNDTITGGAGNDSIVWNVTNGNRFNPARPDGRDFVDGGANGAVGDRFIVTGNNTRENFVIYTVAAAIAAGLSVQNAAAEIVITRNGDVIAELANIEEITINTLDVTADNGNGVPDGGTTGGFFGDNVSVVGDFSGTSLNYSTITVNGDDGDDTVDISQLTSDHRIVFRGGGGDNVLVGGARSQDVLVDARHGSAPGSTDPDSPDGDESAMPEGLVLVGDDTSETFIGAAGNDIIFAGGGADNALGNEGDDMIFGDGGADRIFGGEGNDVIEAGKGDDMVFADAGDDMVIATEDDGRDSYWGGEGSDTLDYAAISQSVEVDLGHGT
ncbi:MAG: hypothetical protein JXJ30_02245, partial [Halothiobacillaceae bacterium]|nr:hypothetical protein [Halothiobacillaceae bacterium]